MVIVAGTHANSNNPSVKSLQNAAEQQGSAEAFDQAPSGEDGGEKDGSGEGRAEGASRAESLAGTDFRKLSEDEHVQLALRIANYIVPPKGRVPSQWVSAEIEKLDRTAGDLDVLKQVLMGDGWKDTGKWTWRQSIPYLNPAATLDDLPPRPNLHQGLKALLTLVHSLPDGQRLVVRLYKSDFVLAGLGEVAFTDSRERPMTILSAHEIQVLSIPRGSLSATERREIESHVTHTFRFLERIPWTRDLAGVPEIAYAHHERLSGRGYPRRLGAGEIPEGGGVLAAKASMTDFGARVDVQGPGHAVTAATSSGSNISATASATTRAVRGTISEGLRMARLPAARA